MAGITTSGIGSGLDINKIVSDLVAAERAPATRRLDVREARLQEQLSAVSTFKGAVSDFRAALAGLRNPSQFQNLTASVGDDTRFGASTTSVAQAGSYSVTVQQLAQAQRLATPADQRFNSVDDLVGTGALTFTFGTYDKDANTFTPNAAQAGGTLTIDPSNNTLAGVRDAINQSNLGVQASIVNDGGGFRLVLGATEAGAANSLTISVADGDGDASDLAGLSLLAYDPTVAAGEPGKNLQQTLAAQDAKLIVDGLEISGTSNTIVGVIPGVTFNLKSAQPDAPTTLTIARDASGAGAAVQSFVDAYNELNATTRNLIAYNPATGQKGPLLGDASVRAISSQIRSVMSGLVPGASGDYRSLSAIGVGIQRDGSLGFERGRLDSALSADPQAVAGLFGRVGGASDPRVGFGGFGVASQPGTYALNVTQIATQAQYVGHTAGGVDGSGSFTIDASNNGFAFQLHSMAISATLTLNEGVYTGNALATELQSLINADSNVKNIGAALRVSYEADANRFTFTSSRYGSAARIEFTQVSAAVQATLGIGVGEPATGRDVAGTIGGVSATGVGQQLAGAGAATGLTVEVRGGGAGARGTISLSDGIALRLDRLLGDFLGSGGPLSNRTESLNDQISRIGDQRQTLAARANALEARYRTQFMIMDKLVAQLTATSNFLTQQFNSLNQSNNT